jgi:hypothetical protein
MSIALIFEILEDFSILVISRAFFKGLGHGKR